MGQIVSRYIRVTALDTMEVQVFSNRKEAKTWMKKACLTFGRNLRFECVSVIEREIAIDQPCYEDGIVSFIPC